MFDEMVKTKLHQSVYLIQPSSGPLLLGIISDKNDVNLTLNFPYEIDGTTIKKFCTYAENRRFELNIFNLVYVKKANETITDIFFEEVLTDCLEEFKVFLPGFASKQLFYMQGNSESEEKILH